MTSKCIMCSENINQNAFKCPSCGSLQLRYRFVQPTYWFLISIAAVIPLIVLAYNAVEDVEPDDVNIDFLSDNQKQKTLNFLIENSSGGDAVIYAAFYESKNDKSYSQVELQPTVLKGNSFTVVSAKLSEQTIMPRILSSFKAVVKSKSEESSTIEKIKYWWADYEPEEWWADQDTCTIHFLISAGDKDVKSVNFNCIKV